MFVNEAFVVIKVLSGGLTIFRRDVLKNSDCLKNAIYLNYFKWNFRRKCASSSNFLIGYIITTQGPYNNRVLTPIRLLHVKRFHCEEGSPWEKSLCLIRLLRIRRYLSDISWRSWVSWTQRGLSHKNVNHCENAVDLNPLTHT